MDSKFFDFGNDEFRDAYVEESFVAEVQYDICRMMKAKGVSRAELARRLKVSAPYITQILSDDDANLTLRTVARVYKGLGERASISTLLNRRDLAEEKACAQRSGELEWADLGSEQYWTKDDELGKSQPGLSTAASDCAIVWLDKYRKAA